ncbi:MAG TPA: alpha-amylase family glycosyl hydrolase [Anaerolineales bacterium]|nr:alpha-amylase family glycosyl hydrolase [Anaerolineales bacterium]
MNIKRLIVFTLSISILLGCTAAPQAMPQPTPEPVTTEPGTGSSPEAWWRDAIFYEIFVRSFYDTDGDGIGDFNGITQKIDYIDSLGVNAIWLMPINPSPSYHGYDVTNYYAVNLDYGTKDDLKNLLNEAHKRDIRIIIDLVINHTASGHPFFQEANNKPNSEYRDWYVWSDSDLGIQWHEGNGGYYFGYFWGGMPDLNYRNPDVTEQMYEVTRYWLEYIGVDGFRVDAAKHLIEEGDVTENTQSTHAWFKSYYTFHKSINPDAYTVGEVFGAGAFIATTYEEQFDHVFNFEIASGIVNSVNGKSNTGITSAWKFTLKDIDDGDYATFLTNHDQNRVMSVFNGDIDKAKLAAFMLLTSPGTPFIYYGEEIGMQGQKPDEDIRLPMQWNDDFNAGFTTGTPWRSPHESFADTNVALQDNDENSLLNHYREMIELRKEYSVLRTGKTILLETGNTGVYAILQSDGEQNMLVLVNLKDETISDYELTMQESFLADGVVTPATIFGSGESAQLTVSDGKFSDYKPLSELPPYSAYLFLIK